MACAQHLLKNEGGKYAKIEIENPCLPPFHDQCTSICILLYTTGMVKSITNATVLNWRP